MAQSKIFIPGLSDYKCISVRSGDVIRAYKQIPNYNTNVQYDDIYPNANYILVSGVQSFGNQYTTLPSCVDSQYLTDDFYYRNDFDKILVIFLIIVIFAIWFPFKLFSRFCKRLWR